DRSRAGYLRAHRLNPPDNLVVLLIEEAHEVSLVLEQRCPQVTRDGSLRTEAEAVTIDRQINTTSGQLGKQFGRPHVRPPPSRPPHGEHPRSLGPPRGQPPPRRRGQSWEPGERD